MTRRLNTFDIKENGLLDSPTEFLEKEKINTRVFHRSHQVYSHFASQVAKAITEHNSTTPLAIAVAADSALFGVYEELIRLHKENKLSFKNVALFQLGEFYPIEPTSLQSYNRWLTENLIEQIDIPKEQVHLIDGTIQFEKLETFIKQYEEKINSYGGIGLFLYGLNRAGYIGFQQPDSSKNCRTRFISLDPAMRSEAASDFFGEEHVPKKAIVIGVHHLLNANKVIIIAVSEGRAKIVKRIVEESSKQELVISLLQEHKDCLLVTDTAAASELTRFKCPWMVKNSLIHIEYSQHLIRKAVIWLSLSVNKPILKLTDDDYIAHNLLDLLTDHGTASKINVQVFNHLNKTITGWPGGKPKAVIETQAPNSPTPREPFIYQTKGGNIFPKKVIIFSPHPDDDVISMGGTLKRLVEQGHEVHVAYQTSGNIAVRDDDAIRFANFATEFCNLFNITEDQRKKIKELEDKVDLFNQNKKPAQPDSREIQQIKGLIRRTEARQAARFCGVLPNRIHFLELPFYETGKVRKNPLSNIDVDIVTKLINKIQPHQIYAAGDLSDPHGTHRVCLQAVFAACEKLKNESWFKQTQVWLYRGAWQEWDLWDIEMAVPMSPAELYNKRLSIFRHQSQKDPPPFPGLDSREFWERSEARNKQTAKFYDQLGLVEYEGMEAFVTWDPENPDNVPY